LACIFDAHPRTVTVSQPQGAGLDFLSVVVKQVVRFPGQFIDAAHIDWINGMLFIHWEKLRPSIKLSRAGKNNFQARIVQPTSL
jgi:hypothetical protein